MKAEKRILTHLIFLFLRNTGAWVRGKGKEIPGLKSQSQSQRKKKLKMLSALICFGQTPVGHCTVRRTKLKRIKKIVPRGLGLEG